MRLVLFFCAVLVVSTGYSREVKQPAGTYGSVLYIGDSQSEGPLGSFVYNHLKKNFHADDIQLYGVGGSSPRHWGSVNSSKRNGESRRWLCSVSRKSRVGLAKRVPTQQSICKGEPQNSVFSYLNRNKPDLVVFQFLGNSMKMSEARILNRIDNLLKHLSDKQKCVWITSTPYFRGMKGKFTKKNEIRAKTEDIFVKAIGDRCSVFRGMKGESWSKFAKTYDYYYSRRPDGRINGDGVHFNALGAEAFYENFKYLLP